MGNAPEQQRHRAGAIERDEGAAHPLLRFRRPTVNAIFDATLPELFRMGLLPLVLKAVGVGIAVAAPVGPMSLFCMRRTLSLGWRAGFVIGAGIATADTICAALATLGLSAISRFLLAHDRPIHFVAGLVLIWLGLHLFRRRATAERPIAGPARSQYVGAMLLTLGNPPTIVTFPVVLAALAPLGPATPATVAATVAGVATGSALWWAGLIGAISVFRHAIGPLARRRIDRASGVTLALFGVLELGRAL